MSFRLLFLLTAIPVVTFLPENVCLSLSVWLDFSWGSAARAERGCRGHQALAVLAGNHDNFLDDYFSRRLDLRDFKGLVDSLKEEYDEDYRKPEGEKQHHEDDHYSVH